MPDYARLALHLYAKKSHIANVVKARLDTIYLDHNATLHPLQIHLVNAWSNVVRALFYSHHQRAYSIHLLPYHQRKRKWAPPPWLSAHHLQASVYQQPYLMHLCDTTAHRYRAL